jgi:hypothetical protein
MSCRAVRNRTCGPRGAVRIDCLLVRPCRALTVLASIPNVSGHIVSRRRLYLQANAVGADIAIIGRSHE